MDKWIRDGWIGGNGVVRGRWMAKEKMQDNCEMDAVRKS